MSDPYLMAMMRGELSNQKKNVEVPEDKFDKAAEQYLEQHVDNLPLEEDDGNNKLVTLEGKKVRMRHHIMSELKFEELDAPVIDGLKYLVSDGKQFLGQDLYDAMLDQFSEMRVRLEDLDFDFDYPANHKGWSNLSQAVLDSIVMIGIAAYDREEYSLCLSIFALLTTVKSDDADYWLRLGVVAKKNNDYDLAIKAFSAALKINTVLIEALLFSAECHLKKGLIQNAKEELAEAKALSATLQLDETFSEFMNEMEAVIAEH